MESQIAPFENLQTYVDDIRQKREVMLVVRARRKQRKADMAKRRTLASQQRMKIISQLAAESEFIFCLFDVYMLIYFFGQKGECLFSNQGDAIILIDDFLT